MCFTDIKHFVYIFYLFRIIPNKTYPFQKILICYSDNYKFTNYNFNIIYDYN